MSLVFVFSGTSEGRELCEKLAQQKINCKVFVATEYGENVMQEDPYINVHVGRLDAEQICDLILREKPKHIVDATHPHAVLVTENIKSACEKATASDKYIRVSREFDDVSSEYSKIVVRVNGTREAVEYLENNYINKSDLLDNNKNIMITTGVKELGEFCKPQLKERIVARILPGMESFATVNDLPIPSKHIIAMEGPFSREINIALIRHFNVGILVTKNSGQRGGFREKLDACKDCNIPVVVIDRPELAREADNVVGIEKAVEMIASSNTTSSNLHKKISIVGAGVLDEKYLTVKALESIKEANLIVGAKRMTEFASTINQTAKLINEYMPEKVIKAINGNNCENIVVLFSGDTGLCSGAKGVVSEITEKLNDAKVDVIPGISSVSYLASKINVQYSDYPFISLHGKDGDYTSLIKKSHGFFAICSGKEDVLKIVADCPDCTIHIGYNLGAINEMIYEINIDMCQEMRDTILTKLNEGLYVLCVRNY